MIDKIFAALGVLVCLALLLRMAIGPARRARLDAEVQRAFARLRGRVAARPAVPPTRSTIDPAEARREAQRLIERARRARPEAERDGNVIRPRAFDGSKKKPPMH